MGMDFSYDMSAKAGVKTLSGSDVTQISERGGNAFISAAGNYATYDSANGALVAPDETTAYYLNSGFTASAAHLVFLLFYVPAAPTNDGIIWGMGSAASVQPTPRTSLLITDDGLVQWLQNDASGIEELGSINLGAWNIIALDFQSDAVCNAYINETTITHTFNPRDNMITQTVPWIMGGDTGANITLDGMAGLKMARAWGRFGAGHGEVGDASMSDIITYLASHYTVTLP